MCNNTVDPDGDVILKLEYPNDSFAPEGGSASIRTQRPDSNALIKSDSPLNMFRSQGIAEPNEVDMTEAVTFRLSSRHLALASPVFKSALTGGWKESVKTEGKLQINSQGWDVTALSIFLNAIHCQYRQVPRALELEMLAKVAVIVDYYAAHQALEILSPIWIDKVRFRLPTTTCHNRTVALWICISWIFGDVSAFETATKTAIHHGRSNMTDFGLPIPDRVIEHINRDRKLQVNRIFNGLSGLQRDLLDGRKGCGIECRTMQLGALTQLLNNTSLLNHTVEKDYQTLSVGKLLEKVEAAVCPTWYEMQRQEPYSSNYWNLDQPTNKPNKKPNNKPTHKPHECPAPGNSFHVAIKSIAKEVDGALPGLRIGDYAKSATESK